MSSRAETGARLVAVLLVLAFPAVTLSQLLGEPPSPAPSQARWSHLVVLSASVWPEAPGAEGLDLGPFARRAARVDQCYAPARSPVACAASLWTGRFPVSHGVRGAEDSLAPNTWTLAEAERASGARTAAFLQEPLVGAAGLEGFERVVEDPSLDADGLARLAREQLATARDRRVCLWLHLSRPTAPELARLLAALEDALGRLRYETTTVVTAFSRPDAPEPDGRSRVPLWIELPGGTSAGLAGAGAASQVDLAGTLVELLALPLPEPGDPPLQSRGDHLWRNLGGGGGFEWLFLEGPHGDVLRFGRTRVAPDGAGGLAAEQTDDPRSDAGFHPAPESLAPVMREQYRVLLERLAEPGD